MKAYPPVPDPWAEFRKVTLKVRDGRKSYYFTIKKSTPLRKLMEVFLEPVGLRLQSVQFRTKDNLTRILPEDTALKLGLRSGDRINFYIGS